MEERLFVMLTGDLVSKVLCTEYATPILVEKSRAHLLKTILPL